MRTLAFCLSILTVWMWACPLPLIRSQAHAEEPATTLAVEILPAETIKLHEYEPDSAVPTIQGRLGEYQRSMDKGPISCEYSGWIDNEGSIKNYSMHCHIQLYASTLYEAGKRPIPHVLIQTFNGSYTFRPGFVYPLPFGELYRVEDLTLKDDQGRYGLLKRVTRQELGIDVPLDYARHYIPIRWPKESVEGGGVQSGQGFRFWYDQEPDIHFDSTKKSFRTVLRCSMGYPRPNYLEDDLPNMSSMIVEEGMILPMVDCGYKILKIVPPNLEKKVSGWVEIDPRPILLRTPLGLALEKLEQQEKQKAAPQPPLAPIPAPKP